MIVTVARGKAFAYHLVVGQGTLNNPGCGPLLWFEGAMANGKALTLGYHTYKVIPVDDYVEVNFPIFNKL